MRLHLLCGAAVAALSVIPQAAFAQDAKTAELEARVRQLEEALAAVKAELAARPAPAPAAPPVIQIPQAQAPAAAPAPPADGFRIGAHTVKYGGFLKLDAMATQYEDGDLPNSDLGRDFLLPATIPIGGPGDEETHFNARQTRLWLTTDGVVAGRKVGTRVEMDFQTLPGAGDQRTTSPSNLSLRRAFITVDNWLFGQEWSTFQNTAVLPETADYIGPTAGTIFVRQAQVRYTRGPFSIAVENPETTVTPFRGGARILADDSVMPDIAAKFELKRPFGDFALAGLVRQLAVEEGAVDDKTTGWGVSFSGKVKVGPRDDLRFMITHGEGIGRYVGLNLANDAVVTASGNLEAIPLTAGFAAYRHVWREGLRSNLIYANQVIDNDGALTGLAVNESSQSLHFNLIWSPIRGLDVGAEVMRAERELESGVSGELNRFQAFAKYSF
ncbi:DcaP family trimeric outer membrane transporter [Phenylobacterium sp.]|uniref:DcaP family trimeric outer membrane transporter n=1 Tax=Phenylobacterium sp. TaxID=1871053 RepID=UPI0035B37FD7